MTNKKKLIITGVGVTAIVLIGGISIFVTNIMDAKKEMEENANYIKENYQNLTKNVESYNQIRTNYTDMSKDFILDTYKDSHQEYLNLLTKYNETIKDIDENIKNISSKCDLIYDDHEVNKICQSYDTLYEKLVNLYITDISNHNEIIDKYNNYKSDKLEQITMIYDNYIDYNNDNTYEGVENNEEN